MKFHLSEERVLALKMITSATNAVVSFGFDSLVVDAFMASDMNATVESRTLRLYMVPHASMVEVTLTALIYDSKVPSYGASPQRPIAINTCGACGGFKNLFHFLGPVLALCMNLIRDLMPLLTS